jgi:hypothetical protein
MMMDARQHADDDCEVTQHELSPLLHWHSHTYTTPQEAKR